jgi:hypothetical protein
MNVKVTSPGPAPQSDIAELERAIGRPLPPQFAAFVSQHDGATPDDNVFRVGSANAAGVNRFIPVSQINAERQSAGLPPGCIPVAWAEGGNLVILDADRAGSIYFWDHELPEDPIVIAADFSEFLKLLRPFVPPGETAPLPSGAKAWIDPEFLRKLKKR